MMPWILLTTLIFSSSISIHIYLCNYVFFFFFFFFFDQAKLLQFKGLIKQIKIDGLVGMVISGRIGVFYYGVSRAPHTRELL